MKYNVSTRKEIRKILNQNIGNTVSNQDFSRTYLLGGYIPVLMERGILERVGRGQYKILKKASTPKRKQPVERTRERKIKTTPRSAMRKFLNKNVGSIVTTQDFTKPATAANYLRVLAEYQFVERIGFGKYKILKQVRLKPRGNKKGVMPKIGKLKDLSSIPTIINSSKEGLVVRQIEHKYKELTPVADQVNRGYLYRFLGYGVKEGIIKHIGTNKELRKGNKGPWPKRLALVNKDITEDEWNKFIAHYIKWYSGKKETRSIKKKVIPGNVGKISSKIIESFKHERENPNKCYVESYFLNIVKHYIQDPIDCMTVTGPDYTRHINNLFSTIAKKITVVEHKHKVFNEIFNQACACPKYLHGDVDLVKKDVTKYISNSQYIDLDLMGSLQSLVDVIYNHFRNQLYLNDQDVYKFLTFTASIRSDGGPEKRLDILKHIFLNTGLNAVLDGFHGEGEPVQNSYQLKFCLKHLPDISDNGRLIDSHIFTYQDTTPMLSVLIVYK